MPLFPRAGALRRLCTPVWKGWCMMSYAIGKRFLNIFIPNFPRYYFRTFGFKNGTEIKDCIENSLPTRIEYSRRYLDGIQVLEAHVPNIEIWTMPGNVLRGDTHQRKKKRLEHLLSSSSKGWLDIPEIDPTDRHAQYSNPTPDAFSTQTVRER